MPETMTEAKHGRSFRPRPHRIEAVRWLGGYGATGGGLEGGCPPWMSEILRKGTLPDETGGIMRLDDNIHVGTPRGILIAKPGDWIVRGPCGALAVIPAGTFREIYEEAPKVP